MVQIEPRRVQTPHNLTGLEHHRTWVDVLRHQADVHADREAFSFLSEGVEAGKQTLSYAELDRRARALAARLQGGVAVGDRALLLCPAGIDYIVGFFGCLYAGVIAIPAYSPRLDHGLQAIEQVAQNAGAGVGIATSDTLPALQRAFGPASYLKDLPWILADGPDEGIEGDWKTPRVDGDDLCCLMFTSGSTASPKGIAWRHADLLFCDAALHDHLQLSAESRLVMWSPPHFSMSLYVGLLLPVYGGFPATILPPAAVLERPVRWLEAISRTGATLSAAPNFAYDLCNRRVTAEERASLDLSTWRVALDGGEQVRPDTIELFASTFAHCGFRQESLGAMYGLGETMAIAITPPDSSLTVRSFQRTALELGVATTAESIDTDAQRLVGCGRVVGARRVDILDPPTLRRCGTGVIGEIWIESRGTAQSYWGHPEITRETLQAHFPDSDDGPFVRTGDLGFLLDDELFVVGRVKEMIIIRGRNLYPQDIELAASQSHQALHSGGAAAFSVEVDDDERLVVVHEVDGKQADLGAVVGAMRQAVATQFEVQVYAVVLIEAGGLPRTASGKIQRQPCRAAFLQDALPVREQSIIGQSKARRDVPPAAPRTAAEEALVRIWTQILDVPGVGIHDNFFEIGGDSLLAATLVTEIAQNFGVKLTPVTLFVGGATIEQLAHNIDTFRRNEIVSPLVPIQPNGSRRPFFFFHGEPDGGGIYAVNLGRHLDPDQPYYLLNSHSFQSAPKPLSMAAMVASQVRALREVQAHGPYRLAGFCAGGLVASEAARQLQAVGEEVDLLLLIDLPPVGARYRVVRSVVTRIGTLRHLNFEQQVLYFCRVLQIFGLIDRAVQLRGKDRVAFVGNTAKKTVQRVIRRGRGSATPPAAATPRRGASVLSDPNLYPLYPYGWALGDYRRQPYAGPVTLVCARDEYRFNREDPKALERKWRATAPQVELHIISGDHDTCKTDFIDEMAAVVQASLTEASPDAAVS